MNANNHPSTEPISEPVFFILLSLAAEHKHGYAILKDVERLSQASILLSTSTLYGALGRLEEQGYVERVPAGGEPAPGSAAQSLRPHIRRAGLCSRPRPRRVQRLADLARRYQIGDPA